MKQIAQNYKTGELALVESPVPVCRPGGVLVRTEYSLISVGTELMKVGEAKLSMLGKVRARPDQVQKVLETMKQQGPQATIKKVMNRLDSYTPLGYSLSGVVVEVGDGVTGLEVGQRVACAGNEYALHAEVNWVPVNLVAAVPDGVDARHSSFTTVGAIAMQGLRQGEPGLGDVAVVIGLGLVGQLLVRLLRANGVHVFGFDLSPDRCRVAEQGGATVCAAPDDDGIAMVSEALAGVSGGFGADQVYLAAGGSSNAPVELAAKLARDRGRVVDIGKCSLDLPWNAYYDKELDVRFSRSYGPGRYDTLYEERGIDYPVGYVRWTENRNMVCFLDLLAGGAIDLAPLVSDVVAFDDAVVTYERIQSGELKGIGYVFEYDPDVELVRSVARPAAGVAPARRGRLTIGFIGCGNYASTMLLPHLTERDDVSLRTVATSTALSSISAQKKFGFAEASSDYRELLADDDIDAVFVVTRHGAHSAMVAEALRAGKAVFVEKPLALDARQLAEVVDAIAETGNDRLHVGFNRRFAPLLTGLRETTGAASGPAMLRYLVNAGAIDPSSWYAESDAHGSRFVGEGGHFIDTLAYWVDADPVEVFALRAGTLPDDVQANIGFDDGSVGVITYTTVGSRRFPKETFEAVRGGTVARLDNFSSTSSWGTGRRRRQRALTPDKGQRAQVDAFVAQVRSGGPMPIPLSSLLTVTAATIAVDDSLSTGAPVKVIVPGASVVEGAGG